jgi:mannosyltransferase
MLNRVPTVIPLELTTFAAVEDDRERFPLSTSEYPAQRLKRLRPQGNAGALRAREIPAEVWITGGLVLLAAAIRIIVIDTQSFWWDEALTAYETRLPFGAMINTVLHVETTPPLYFVLIWTWAHIFGSGEIALRAVSTLAGVAVVPLAYLIGRELFSRRAGVLAAAFIALNPFMVWYSQEARAYTLLTALTAASFLWFVRAERAPSPRPVAWWAVFSSLALMTHFFAGFAVAPEAVWLLWRARTRPVIAAVAAVAVVQLLMVPFASSDTTHGVGWIAAIPRIRRIAMVIVEWPMSNVYRRATVTEALLAGAVLVAVVAWLVVRRGDPQTRAGAKVVLPIVGFVFLVPLALGYVGQDYFLDRNLIPAFVPVMTLIAAACVLPRARLLGGTFAVALLATFAIGIVIVQTDPTLERPNWRAVAHTIGPASTPRAILYAGGTYANPLKIYLPHVNWVQPPKRLVPIGEIDVVGAPKWLRPTKDRLPLGATLRGRAFSSGAAINRYALPHTRLLSVESLVKLAPRIFRRTPRSLLFFFQQPGA